MYRDPGIWAGFQSRVYRQEYQKGKPIEEFGRAWYGLLGQAKELMPRMECPNCCIADSCIFQKAEEETKILNLPI